MNRGFFSRFAFPAGWFARTGDRIGWFSALLLAEPEPPTVDPEPEVVSAVGVPGGGRRPARQPRVAVRINGVLHVGSYAEINALVAAIAQRDAVEAAAATPEPVATQPKVAKKLARKAAGDFGRTMQVIDVGMPQPVAVDPAPIAQRDLRAEYLRAYAVALLVAQREAERVAAEMTRQAIEVAMARRAVEEARDADDIALILETLEMID